MKKMFSLADEYLKICGWRDLALVKLCLGTLGILIGLAMPKKIRVPVALVATGGFLASYVPIMIRFIQFTREEG